MPEKVELSEVAPRDGLQSIGPFVPTDTKIALVRACYEAGLRRMEVGSFVSPRAVPQMADTGDVLKAAKQLEGLESTVLDQALVVPGWSGATASPSSRSSSRAAAPSRSRRRTRLWPSGSRRSAGSARRT